MMYDGYIPHVMVYGDAGTSKSTFAATLPKPQVVSVFDPLGKDQPYVRRGRPQPFGETPEGIPFRDIWYKNHDEVAIRLEYFFDAKPQAGAKATYAWERFLYRYEQIEEEVARGQWASYVVDSFSGMQHCVLVYNQFKLNPTSKSGNTQDGRQWYAAVAQEASLLAYNRLAWLPIPVCLTAHVQDKADTVRGELLYLPAAPGQGSRRLPGVFSEVYYAFVDDEGNAMFQTRKDGKFIATTQLPLPMYVEPHWSSLRQAPETAVPLQAGRSSEVAQPQTSVSIEKGE